jgi:hypothetical protein
MSSLTNYALSVLYELLTLWIPSVGHDSFYKMVEGEIQAAKEHISEMQAAREHLQAHEDTDQCAREQTQLSQHKGMERVREAHHTAEKERGKERPMERVKDKNRERFMQLVQIVKSQRCAH